MESNNQSMHNSTITITTNPYVKMNVYGHRVFEAQPKAYCRLPIDVNTWSWRRWMVVYAWFTMVALPVLWYISSDLNPNYSNAHLNTNTTLPRISYTSTSMLRWSNALFHLHSFWQPITMDTWFLSIMEFIQLEAMCSICLDEFSKSPGCRFVATKCSHVYHEACILPWVRRNNTCPNCRGTLNKGCFGSFVSGHKFKLWY